MKKNLLFSLAAFIFLCTGSRSQQVQIYDEDFTPPVGTIPGGLSSWFIDSAYYTSASSCYRDTVPAGAAGTNNYFTTPSFDCSGNGYVAFEFKHICKIPAAQRATIEVSVNGAGGPWTTLTGIHYRTNYYRPGSSLFFATNGYFSSAEYPTAWYAAAPTRMPDSTWWRKEIFDISAIAAFQPDVRIRFKLTNIDGNGSNTREYGWLVDDINVQVAPDFPPEIYLTSTNAGASTLGPFYFNTVVPQTGVNCCNIVTMYWTVNGGPVSNIMMTNPSTNQWTCTIPAVNALDTVCYYFQVLNWNNVEGNYPPAFLPYSSVSDPFNTQGGANCFLAFTGILLPYFENFDISQGGWTPDSISGSEWQWGTPNVGVTSGCYSFPNCWDIDLHQQYVSNTHAYLYSPEFTLSSFSGNLLISFWRNHNSQVGHDGMSFEYDFNNSGIWTTLGSIGDTNATNWFDTTISGSGVPFNAGWSGNTGGTWVQSSYRLNQFIGQSGTLQFRFVFDSDGFGNLDGVSVDDFYFGPMPTAIETPDRYTANFSIYPNPSTGKFSVVTGSPIKNNLQLVVTDVLGKIIRKESFPPSGNLQLDISDQANGIYIVTLLSESGVSYRKITVCK